MKMADKFLTIAVALKNVPAAQLAKQRIRIVQHEYVYDAFVSETCRYCKGTAKRPYGPEDAWQSEVQECKSCNAGSGARYLSEMPKPVRNAAVKALNAAGWHVAYEKRGRHWFMERETVIKDVSV